MQDSLQRIAALLPTLSAAELRVLIILTATSHRSTRAVATAAGLARSNAQAAVHSLAEKGFIDSDGGTATRAPHFQLSYLTVMPITQVLPEPGPKSGPPLDLSQGHPGPVLRPPPGLTAGPPPRTRESSTSGSIQVLDRLLRAKPQKFDDELTVTARQWLYGFMRKFGREIEPHPPDSQIIAQFLSIAPWPQLEHMLNQLVRENCEAGKTYAWFIAVALQRIHGINPTQLRERRAALQMVRAPKPPAAVQAPLLDPHDTEPDVSSAIAYERDVRAMAKAKALR